MMGFYSDDLLKQSYDHYIKTGERRLVYAPSSGLELNRYLEAAHYLVEYGYIFPGSGNIMSLEYNPTAEDFISFDITDAGIAFVKDTLK